MGTHRPTKRKKKKEDEIKIYDEDGKIAIKEELKTMTENTWGK